MKINFKLLRPFAILGVFCTIILQTKNTEVHNTVKYPKFEVATLLRVAMFQN